MSLTEHPSSIEYFPNLGSQVHEGKRLLVEVHAGFRYPTISDHIFGGEKHTVVSGVPILRGELLDDIIVCVMGRGTEVKKIITKVSMHNQPSDFAYWSSQPYCSRLDALERIRQEYHHWRYGAEPRLQRVYSIAKR